MTRTVYPYDMVCHLWARRHPVDVRTSTGNLYTRGPRLYSYGSHYIIGEFLADGAVLLNDRRVSVTTARHSSRARQALARDAIAYLVPDITGDRADMAQGCVLKICEALRKAIGARKYPDSYIANARSWMRSAAYLQPSLSLPVIGCHEFGPAEAQRALALIRETMQ